VLAAHRHGRDQRRCRRRRLALRALRRPRFQASRGL
jgi:hypothetical protein